MNYYNEFDPHAAAWLKQLIAEGLIPPGEVDQRSITDVSPNDLSGFTQCHFFAGVGGWALALALAGWPADRPIWTGSCPCQPFSVAGQGKGEADERHLWPAFFNLIRERRPDVVFGEQVEAAVGHGWLDGIRSDLEGEGYACGDATLGAHSVGAPHQRQRLYWVADAKSLGLHQQCGAFRGEGEKRREVDPFQSSNGSRVDAVADGQRTGLEGHGRNGIRGGESGWIFPEPDGSDRARCADTLDHPDSVRAERTGREEQGIGIGRETGSRALGDADITGFIPRGETSPTAGYGDPADSADFWADSRLILCRDGKHRRIPIEPALFPLADGLPYKLARGRSARAALLRGAGNAIVPQVAAQFVRAFMEISDQ